MNALHTHVSLGMNLLKQVQIQALDSRVAKRLVTTSDLSGFSASTLLFAII